MTPTVLIVSSGRTGTQFLARYFDANFEGVVGRHEPAPRYRLRMAVNAYAAGALSRDRMLRMLVARRRRLERGLRASLYVESNPFLWGAVDLFDEAFERPVVVHVVRDPRDQLRSSLGHGTGSGWKALANRWLPYWYPKRAMAAADDWVTRAASMWVVVNERLAEHGPRCAHYHLVRYEDLFDEDHTGLRQLCDRLGLSFVGVGSGAAVDPGERLNQARRETIPDWRGWSEARCASVARIAGPLMERYGYGGEPGWPAGRAEGAG